MREPVQRAVALGHREEQRHAGERQEQLIRKAAHHGRQRHAGEVHADDPRERDREHADVHTGDAAQDDARMRAATEIPARFMRGQYTDVCRLKLGYHG